MADLKTLIQDLINGKTEQAEITAHEYLLDKVKAVLESMRPVQEAIDSLSAIINAIKKTASPRGSVIEFLGAEADDDKIQVDVRYDFPENLVMTAEVKKAGATALKRVSVQKNEKWNDGEYNASFTLHLKSPLSASDCKSLKKMAVTEALNEAKKFTAKQAVKKFDALDMTPHMPGVNFDKDDGWPEALYTDGKGTFYVDHYMQSQKKKVNGHHYFKSQLTTKSRR
jgi:hypothetical protein